MTAHIMVRGGGTCLAFGHLGSSARLAPMCSLACGMEQCLVVSGAIETSPAAVSEGNSRLDFHIIATVIVAVFACGCIAGFSVRGEVTARSSRAAARSSTTLEGAPRPRAVGGARSRSCLAKCASGAHECTSPTRPRGTRRRTSCSRRSRRAVANSAYSDFLRGRWFGWRDGPYHRRAGELHRRERSGELDRTPRQRSGHNLSTRIDAPALGRGRDGAHPHHREYPRGGLERAHSSMGARRACTLSGLGEPQAGLLGRTCRVACGLPAERPTPAPPPQTTQPPQPAAPSTRKVRASTVADQACDDEYDILEPWSLAAGVRQLQGGHGGLATRRSRAYVGAARVPRRTRQRKQTTIRGLGGLRTTQVADRPEDQAQGGPHRGRRHDQLQ